MPELLPPEAAGFEVRDGVPVIVLAVELPEQVVEGEWSVLRRMTMLVVDGPGESGFLLPRLGPHRATARDHWPKARSVASAKEPIDENSRS
jgi:hypothetical protein